MADDTIDNSSTFNWRDPLNTGGFDTTPIPAPSDTFNWQNPTGNADYVSNSTTNAPVGGGQTTVTPSGGYDTGTEVAPDTTASNSLGSGLTDYLKRVFTGTGSGADYVTGLMGLLALSQLKKNTTPLGYSGPGVNMSRTFTRTPNAQQPYTPYSGKPVMGQQYGTTTYAAKGGIMGLSAAPRYLAGPTDGMADKINTSIDGQQKAKLSHGEFVIPADVVSHLGNGNSDAGAQALYKMMDRVRKARTGTTQQGKQIDPAKFTPGGIAGYAGGGAVAFADGGTTTGTTISGESNLSSWAGPYVTDMLSKTAALTNAPYQAYTGPLTAGTSPLQQTAYTGLQNIPAYGGTSFSTGLGSVGTTQDYLSPTYQQYANLQPYQGANITTALPSASDINSFLSPTSQAFGDLQYQGANITSGLGPVGSVQDYVSPYIQTNLTPQLQALQRQADIARQTEQAKYAAQGAFGGGRSSVSDALANEALQRNIAATTGQTYQSAYDKALQQQQAAAQMNLTAQQATEASRQFGANYGLNALQQQQAAYNAAQQAQLAASQQGLTAQQATEASRQFGAQQGMNALAAQQSAYQAAAAQRAQEAQLNLTAQQQQEASRQFGAQYGLQALAAQQAAGAQQQAAEQKAIDAAHQQWLEEQQYPYKQLQFQQSMLQGLPVSAYQQTNQADLLTQLLTGGTGLAALYKLLNTGTTGTTGTTTGGTNP